MSKIHSSEVAGFKVRGNDGTGRVEVETDGGLKILAFEHHNASGAAHEITIALQNAFRRGEQAGYANGLRKGAIEVGKRWDEHGVTLSQAVAAVVAEANAL